jgi:hypothetical protein
LNGLHTFLTKYRDHPRFDRAHLVARLQATTPTSVAALARDFGRGGVRPRASLSFGQAVLTLYNVGPKKGRLPAWYVEANDKDAVRDGG